MATDNRTNGQIVSKALVAHCEEHKMPFPRGSIKKIVEALRDAGRLAGEPTETQVEAATRERDAALARVEELEAELEVAMRPHSECERSGAEAGERIVDLEGDLARAEARIAEAAKQLAEVLDQHDKDEDGATEYLDPTERRLQVAIRALNRVDQITEALGLNEGETDEV